MIDFEWDSAKADANLRKHGISFSEAATIFGDPFEITISDPDHSVGEERFMSIGRSVGGLVLVASYTERDNRIRLISARPATSREVRQYEN